MVRLILIIAIFIATCTANTIPPLYRKFVEDVSHIRPANDIDYLLPKTSRPINYNIELSTKIDEGLFPFEGRVEIEIEILEFTSNIVLHSYSLTIKNIKLMKSDRLSVIKLKSPEHSKLYDFLTIHTEEDVLIQGETYFLTIEYNGVLRDDEAGFYKSSYINENGEPVWLATTQFESTDARHGFPCYDEPAIKATFQVAINHGCTYHALSNMPESRDFNDDGSCKTSFAKTEKMSTYLLAFIVSDYQSRENYEGVIKDTRLKHRIFARSKYIEHTAKPLEWSEEILNDLEVFLNIKYGFPKMDQIGIPDFAAGAMENWGLVTYGEDELYYPADHYYNKETWVTQIIAHEYAHQWFGNLVSPSEWGYLWLNEGFATFFEFTIPEHLFPDKRHMDLFSTQDCQRAKQSDSLVDQTRPMSSPVYDPLSISQSFDNIAYAKSGCVINMLMHSVSEERFKRALELYLKNRSFDNANPDHLSDTIDTIVKEAPAMIPSSVHFKTILDSWHLTAGIPILYVNYNRDSGAINLTQHRYNLDGKPDESEWWIPYNFVTTKEASKKEFEGTLPDGWLSESHTTILPSTSRDWKGEDWILFNKKQTGYYRVNYDADNWYALANGLKSDNAGNIPYLNRAHLIADAIDFALIGLIDFDIPFKLMEYLPERETDYFPWKMAFTGLNSIHMKLFGSSLSQNFKLYIKSLVAEPFKLYGLVEKSTENHYDNFARQSLIEWACKSLVDECLTGAANALKSHIDGETEISDFLKTTIFTQGSRTLDRSYFIKFWTLQQQSTVSADRLQILRALGAVHDIEIQKLLLDTVIIANNEQVEGVTLSYTENERKTIIDSLINNENLSSYFYELWMNQSEEIKKYFTVGTITSIFNNLARALKTQADLENFEKIIAKYQVDKETTDKNIKTIEENIKWLENEGKVMKDWLEEYYPTGPNVAPGIFISRLLLLASLCITLIKF